MARLRPQRGPTDAEGNYWRPLCAGPNRPPGNGRADFELLWIGRVNALLITSACGDDAGFGQGRNRRPRRLRAYRGED